MGNWLTDAVAGISKTAAPAKSTSNIRALLAARRKMVDASPSTWRPVPGEPPIPLVISRTGASPSRGAWKDIDRVIQNIDRGVGGGFFASSTGRYPELGVVAYKQGDYGTRRHEVMHGYTEAARQGYPGMPLASRVAARLPHSLSTVLDEMAATSAGGGSVFLKNWPFYARYYAERGDYGPAALYGGISAAQAAAPVAAAVGLGLGIRRLRGDGEVEEDPPAEAEELGELSPEDRIRYLALLGDHFLGDQ
jgi:hypothetical protein